MPHLRFAATKEQRVAVITGGARGLGRACALRIAEEGRHIVLADVLDEEASETVEAIHALDQDGFYTKNDSVSVQISPAPFVLLPSLGETLDFSYSFPNKSRVIIRIYDLSGRFITSLVDKYYPNSGIVKRDEASSAWDGRDQLGQIVSSGTYIMQIEAMNPVTGETQTDATPIVVGVKN